MAFVSFVMSTYWPNCETFNSPLRPCPPLTGFVTTTPGYEFETHDLEEYLRPLASDAVLFPENSRLSDQEWAVQFEQHEHFLWQCWRAFRGGIETQLRPQGAVASISPCWQIDGGIVAIVATFGRFEHDQYPHLDWSIRDKEGRWPSLHFGVIEVVLHYFSEDLRMKDAGRLHGFEVDRTKEFVRTAGAFFTRNHAWAEKRFSQLDVEMRGTIDFYETCNSISTMPYESREGRGVFIVADRAHLAVTTIIELEKPFLVTDLRRVRKMLEMSRPGLSVLTDSRYVWGWGNIVAQNYFPAKAEVLTIQFLGHGHWRLAHQQRDLMEVRDAEPKLPLPRFDSDALRDAISKRFPELQSESVNNLVELVGSVVASDHGTTIVISKNATSEAERLSKPHGGIKPFSPDPVTLGAATTIDGAIMIDLDGTCRGIGLILDGHAATTENAARGARFNSANRYLHDHSDTLIIVVSEDNTIDFLPA